MSTDPQVLFDGKSNAKATIVFAHGAGAGMQHDFMQTIATGLAAHDLRVARFEFSFMHARREGRRPGPDRMPKLIARFQEVLASLPGPLVLAGKSMGGRVATMIADDVHAKAVIVFGYPFHPPGKLDNLRTAHLENLRTPTLILQGERDTFGTREQVASYTLSPNIQMCWLKDGDHSLKPRKQSGLTHDAHLQSAIDRTAAFVQTHT